MQNKTIKRTIALISTCTFLSVFSQNAYSAIDTSENTTLEILDIGQKEEIYDLILEVKHGRKTLSSTLSSIDKSDKYYISLLEISDILQFELDINLDTSLATGFFLNPEKTFELDIESRKIIDNDKVYEFDKTEVFIYKEKFSVTDVYVTVDVLNKMLSIEADLNPLRQILFLKDDQKIPADILAEQKLKRNKRLNQLNKDDKKYENLTKVGNPYKLISAPVIDLSYLSQYRSDKQDILHDLNINGRNDFLKFQANYNFGFSQKNTDNIELDNARLFFEHIDYEDKLPLDLELIQLGDIRPNSSQLVQGTTRGRGLLLSTKSMKQKIDFDLITIEGLAEPGWEAELYLNNELLGFQIVDRNGEYRFENITLNYNKNIFRTVLYGPQGQVKESIKEYNISSDMLKPRQTFVEASLIDVNRNLIQTNLSNKNAVTGISSNIKIQHGFFSWLSGFANSITTPTIEGDKHYVSSGFNISGFGATGAIEAYKDIEGGQAVDLRAASNIKGINFNLRSSIFSNFESEFAGYGDNKKILDTQLTASKSIKTPFATIGKRLRVNHIERENKKNTTQIDFSQNLFKKNISVTNSNSVKFTNDNHQSTDGRIALTYRGNPKWQARALLNYDITPEKSFQNIFSDLRYRINKKTSASLGFDYNLKNNKTKVDAELTRDFDNYRASVDVGWSDQAGFSSLLRLSSSIGPYGDNNSYIASSKNLSTQSSLSSNIFLDKNYNMIFDEVDEVIEGASLDIGVRETPPSNQHGRTHYMGGTKNEYEPVTIKPDSLNGLHIKPAINGYETLLRPASHIHLDFPIFETGLIDGFIAFNEEPAAKVKIELLAQGKVIKTTLTLFDGYYSFEDLMPGDYEVRIAKEHENIHSNPQSIKISPEKLSYYDINFSIKERHALDNSPLPFTEEPKLENQERLIEQIVVY